MKSLTNGTRLMDSNKNGFTAKDLCDIIKTCSETGLAELKFGELQLSFVKKAEEEVVKEQQNLTPLWKKSQKHSTQSKPKRL